MALFGKKQNTKKKEDTVLPVMASIETGTGVAASKKHTGDILIAPRITEKGSYLAEQGCYVFNVATGANKKEIARAVQQLFGVVPRMVRTVHVRGKRMITRGTNRVGKSASGKKAYVFLKKGEKIELI